METCVREIEILIFSVMGIRLAVDTTQVKGVLEMEQAAAKDVVVFNIPDQLKINSGPPAYGSPKVLLVNSDNPDFGIIVDQLEEIEAVGLDRIYPMPALIDKCPGANAIWGSVADGDEVVLLIDFYRLPCCSPTAESG